MLLKVTPVIDSKSSTLDVYIFLLLTKDTHTHKLVRVCVDACTHNTTHVIFKGTNVIPELFLNSSDSL